MMMKNVAIATDSHSSITPEMAQTLGVAVLPMPFTIDGTCYLEEETLTRAEFYAHQRRGAKIATSQPAPADVTALWDNLLTDHDEVVYIPISSGLSGSCQAAMALAADAPYAGRVFVVDNGRVATALHVTVLDALRLRDAGDDAATIKRGHVHLRRGGDTGAFEARRAYQHGDGAYRYAAAHQADSALHNGNAGRLQESARHESGAGCDDRGDSRGISRAICRTAGAGAGDAAGGIECLTGSDGGVGSAPESGVSGDETAQRPIVIGGLVPYWGRRHGGRA